MSTTMTLAQLRTAAQQRADMVNSNFVSETEWNSYVNQSYFELYDLLVQKYGNDYYVAEPVQITTDGTSTRYALPNGTLYSAAAPFFKLLGLDIFTNGVDPDSAVSLKPFSFAERNRSGTPNSPQYYGITNLRYRIQGNNLWLMPTPTGGQVLQLWYVPKMTTLTTDTDTVEGVSGWTEYIIIDAAIKAMQKEESDVSVLFAQKQAMIARIEAAAENRDAANPATIADTQGQGFDDGFGWNGP